MVHKNIKTRNNFSTSTTFLNGTEFKSPSIFQSSPTKELRESKIAGKKKRKSSGIFIFIRVSPGMCHSDFSPHKSSHKQNKKNERQRRKKAPFNQLPNVQRNYMSKDRHLVFLENKCGWVPDFSTETRSLCLCRRNEKFCINIHTHHWDTLRLQHGCLWRSNTNRE